MDDIKNTEDEKDINKTHQLKIQPETNQIKKKFPLQQKIEPNNLK